LYLSVDTRITTNDLRIGTRTIATGLAAGESSTAATLVNLPFLSTGRYRLGAIVDDIDGAVESDESNNSLVGNPIEITAVALADVQFQGGDVVLRFASAPGKNYRVE